MSKRKRDIIPEDDEDKLEINIDLPEPPSKKAKRKEKKLLKKPESTTDVAKVEGVADAETQVDSVHKAKAVAPASTDAKRSRYSIWVGNLPFKATKDTLRRFFLDQGGIDEADITRTHLPTAEKGQNKGFAYVDFTSQAILDIALGLTEKLIAGRRCLIKNAASFEGRPAKSEKEEERAGGYISKKEPTNRIFVGNLSFDMTKEELAEHFSQAGQVDNTFLATFEDSGKCKGFGWITFADIEAAEKAVRGFIFKDAGEEDVDDGSDGSDVEDEKKNSKKRKPAKPRKWFINKVHGRLLRCEFAEDAHTRYSKRFRSGASNGPRERDALTSAETDGDADGGAGSTPAGRRSARLARKSADTRRDDRRKRFDARKIAPGKALANAPRASGAIVAGAGTKVTFD